LKGNFILQYKTFRLCVSPQTMLIISPCKGYNYIQTEFLKECDQGWCPPCESVFFKTKMVEHNNTAGYYRTYLMPKNDR